MIYWVTLKPPTRHDRASRVPDFISPLKSKDGGPNGAGSSARVPGFVFESGYSKRESPDSFANMQVYFLKNSLQVPNNLSFSFSRSRPPPGGPMRTASCRPLSELEYELPKSALYHANQSQRSTRGGPLSSRPSGLDLCSNDPMGEGFPFLCP